MKIPYGQSNFADLRREGRFYVDKTPFIAQLEDPGPGFKHLLFLRPRRFGKSLLVSMLEHYYDLDRAEVFDELFRGLWIHEHPTAERSSYLVLKLDFSTVSAEGSAQDIRRSFTANVKASLRSFLMRYKPRFPDLSALEPIMASDNEAADVLTTLLAIIAGLRQKLYVLIDEYDHFANRLLSDGDQEMYEAIVRGTGFVRTFYAALKAGTSMGALSRMFITGVSPLLLDDLSSGFNIIQHVSLSDRFHAMAGFTRADVERATDEFLAARPHLRQDPRLGDRAQLLDTLERYYNGYRFSRHAAERVYNSDLILYFFAEINNTGRYPEQMLDINVRTDYGRLQRIAALSGAAGAQTRALLETILVEERVETQLVERFGVQMMDRPEQLVSLFYYMGMLTFSPDAAQELIPKLVIPNRVMRTLQWEYLAIALREQEQLSMDTQRLNSALVVMATRGDIEPLLALFREEVLATIGVKDQRQFNEGTLKLMMVAYILNSRIYHILSEKELARGYCDLFLSPAQDLPALRYAWMIEVKHLKTNVKQAEIDKAVAQAYIQLERYSSDAALVPALTRGRELKCGALIFIGAKDVLFYPWPPPPPPAGGPRKAAPRKAAPRKAAPRKAAPRKAAPRKAAPRKAAPRKAAPRKAAPRRAPR